MMNWLEHLFGLDNLSGPWYGFWSGVGGDVALFTIAPSAYILMRKHQCHVKGCMRVGRYRVANTHWVVCSRHHPDDDPTHKDVLSKAQEANNP